LNFTDEVITVYGAVEAGVKSERELAYIDEGDIELTPGDYTTYLLRTTDTSSMKWKP